LIVSVDGNDGTGKSSLVVHLRARYPSRTVQDRGLPTAMIDGKATLPAGLYIILTPSVVPCQRRLLASGKSLNRTGITDPTKERHL